MKIETGCSPQVDQDENEKVLEMKTKDVVIGTILKSQLENNEEHSDIVMEILRTSPSISFEK